MATEGFGVLHTQRCTWEIGKGKDRLDCVIWRRRRKGMESEPEVKLMGKVKEIEAPALARRSIPSRRTGQVHTTRKK